MLIRIARSRLPYWMQQEKIKRNRLIKEKRQNVAKGVVDRLVFQFKRKFGDVVRSSQCRIGPRRIFYTRVFVRQARRHEQIIR